MTTTSIMDGVNNKWRVHAIQIIESHIDVPHEYTREYINDYWQNQLSDEENLLNFFEHTICTEEFMINLENAEIKDGQLVYWKDPAGETSDIYKVQGDSIPFVEEDEDVYEDGSDDRIIDITSTWGSQVQVYPCELYLLKHMSL